MKTHPKSHKAELGTQEPPSVWGALPITPTHLQAMAQHSDTIHELFLVMNIINKELMELTGL